MSCLFSQFLYLLNIYLANYKMLEQIFPTKFYKCFEKHPLLYQSINMNLKKVILQNHKYTISRKSAPAKKLLSKQWPFSKLYTFEFLELLIQISFLFNSKTKQLYLGKYITNLEGQISIKYKMPFARITSSTGKHSILPYEKHQSESNLPRIGEDKISDLTY